MTDVKLIRGRTYRAKKPRNARGFYNDRTIIYIGRSEVQYDSPSISMGRNYPTMDKDKFLKWAGEDITDRLPEGEYELWCSK